ncbi:MAG: hypothetical protein KAS69_05060 [Planctomycetes bacterium]|nr:hypothetical protein [Planctomycetota bacterium]
MIDGFDKIRMGGRALCVNRNFRNEEFEEILLSGEENLKQNYKAVTVPSSKFASVLKLTVKFNDAEETVYFKQYLYRSFFDFIKHFFRSSRAQRAFTAAIMLEKNGFRTPTIVAIGKNHSRRADKFLITLEINGTESIRKFISESLAALGKEQLKDRRCLICEFGRTVGRMHAAGICHGDLRLGNVLVKKEGGNWQFFFLDNERTKKLWHLPLRLRLKNLVQINMFRAAAINSADRMRFFKSYLKENPKLKSGRNKLAAKIVSKTFARMK